LYWHILRVRAIPTYRVYRLYEESTDSMMTAVKYLSSYVSIVCYTTTV